MQCNGCCLLILIRNYIFISNFFYPRKNLFARKYFWCLRTDQFRYLQTSNTIHYFIRITILQKYTLHKAIHYITLHKAIHNIKSTHKKRKHTYYGQDEAKCWYVFDTFFFTLAKKTPQMAFWLLWSWTRHPCLQVPCL